MEKLYSTQSAKTRLGADCGSDHELLIAKFRHKLKKLWKTTRPFRYDLNQIPYDYTMEVTNRLNGLDLIDRVPEELWMEVHPRRDSRGERSPWLPLVTRPDSPGEPGMQPRDPCLPWRGKLGPGHTLR